MAAITVQTLPPLLPAAPFPDAHPRGSHLVVEIVDEERLAKARLVVVLHRRLHDVARAAPKRRPALAARALGPGLHRVLRLRGGL